MRILITGSREWNNHNAMAGAFSKVYYKLHDDGVGTRKGDLSPRDDLTLVHGDARGADRMAERIGPSILRSLFRNVYVKSYPADWEEHGKRAGPIRNQEMVDMGADLCLAFFVNGAGNRGTSDCVRRAEAADIPVMKFYSDRFIPGAIVDHVEGL